MLHLTEVNSDLGTHKRKGMINQLHFTMPFPSLPPPGRTLLLLALFFAATFAAYGPSLGSEFVSWDDTSLIAGNPIVAAMNPHTLKKAFTTYDPELYIPLTLVSYQIDHIIGGWHPFVYHFTNLLLHTCSALLITWLLYLLLGTGWTSIGLGLLFALHPLNTEAVAWASARKDVLSTFFFLASIIAYLYATNVQRRKLLVLSIVFFLFGLLSKVMVVTLPVVLIILDVAGGRTVDRRVLCEKIPYVILSILFGIVALFGKSSVLVSTTLWQKSLMAGKSTVFYVEKFLWPSNLSVIYPYTGKMSLRSLDVALPMFLMILLVGAALWLWKRSRMASAAIFFFIVTLAPTFTNFAKGGDVYFASDRYAYVPMIGLLLLVGLAISYWLQAPTTVRAVRVRKLGTTAVFACILLVCAVLSARQAQTVWLGSISLYEHTLALYPNARAAHNNLGMEHLRAGETDLAIAEFNAALTIGQDPRVLVNLADAYLQKGRMAEAKEIFQRVIRLDPTIPNGYSGIGNVYLRQGKLTEAAEQYRRAIAVDPTYVNAYNDLGAVMLKMHDWKQAIATLEKSIELKPDFVESIYNLAIAYQELKQNERAEELYRKVIALNPEDADALSNLATLLYDRKQIDAAAGTLKHALSIDQSNPTGMSLLQRMKRDGFVR